MRTRGWFLAAVLAAIVGCGGDGGGGSPTTAAPASPLLVGMAQYDGPFPARAPVTYLEGSSAVTIQAYPGQLIVYFAAGTAEADAEAAIAQSGGSVLAKTPLLGHYLVGTSAGAEGSVIANLRAHPIVALALPHAATLYMSGATIIDGCGGPHGEDVEATYLAAGGQLKNCRDDDDGTGQPALQLTLEELYKEIDTRGAAPAVFNLSTSGGLNGTDYTALASDVAKKEARDNWKAVMRIFLAGLAALPEARRENVVITLAAGNGNMPLAALLAEIRADAKMAKILSDHVLLVSASDSVYRNGNDAPGDPDVALMADAQAPDGSVGTSFAAPKAAAIIEKLVRQKELSPKEAILAAKMAVATNANRVLVESEAMDKADAINQAKVTAEPNAAKVTSITFATWGGSNVVVLGPAYAGISVQYTVSGTDGYYQSGTLVTDGSGRVSFGVPAGPAGTVDTISASVVLTGLTATRTYTW